MICSRCGLPFTADYPEYNPGAGYHEAMACIRGLRAALVKHRRRLSPRSTAAGGEADSAKRIQNLRDELEELRRLIWAERDTSAARIAKAEAELAKLRETLEIYAAPENWMIDVIDYDLAEFVAWCPAGNDMHGHDPWTIAELRLRPPAPEKKP